MVVSSAVKNSSTKALLNLFIDGKEISDQEIKEPLKALKAMTDMPHLIEEVYLMAMYLRLNNLDNPEEMLLAINRIEEFIKTIDVKQFENMLIFYKFCFAKVLCGLKIKPLHGLSSFARAKNLSSLNDLALLGSLSLFIGCFLQDPLKYEEGCAIAELVYDLVNKNGEVDVFFFFEKGGYEKDTCRVSVFILLSLYSYVKKDFEGLEVLGSIDPYEGGLFQSLEVEKRLQCRLLEIVKPFTLTIEKRENKKILSDQLIKMHSGKFSYLTSPEKKVGIGSISYDNKLIIPSFGPHVLPLGKNDFYGLNDPITKNVEHTETYIKMWNRVKSKCQYGNHWIHTHVESLEEKFHIESFLWSEKKEEKISLIFFLRGTEVEVNNKRYLSKGLERVTVKANKVDVKIDGKRLQILLKESKDLEIIPLAGEQYFWNSDFILSLPFNSDRISDIELVMD